MPLDPELVPLLEQVNALPPMSLGSAVEGRDRFRQMSVAAQALSPRVEVGAVEDVEVPGAEGPLAGRIYRPERPNPTSTLLFIHGGGFVIGDIASYDSQCRILCREVHATVLALEYRLAPEDPFPAAVEDAIAACEWTLSHVGALGADATRVVVAGDSAGGNLAAVVSQALRGSVPGLAAQLLLYPVTDFSSERPSHEETADGLFLTRDDMSWFEAHYLGDADPREDPRVSPLAGDLSGLPPAIVVTAEMDPLRDDGEAYADALEAAGVAVVRHRFDGLVHGFFAMGAFSSTVQVAIDEICGDLGRMLE